MNTQPCLRTMNALEAVELTQRIKPKLAMPIHHTTIAHYPEPIEALQQLVQERGQEARFRFLVLGERAEL